jgi:cation:H+ antiporter
MLNHLLIYILSFAGIWVGSGFVVRSVERLSRTLRISSFMISFLVLGFFTSVSELSVGVNAVMQNDPEIYVGNLIGASIVLFLLIVPLLAITGKKIHITEEFQGFNLPASLVVIAVPAILSLDGVVTKVDAYISLLLFVFLILSLQVGKGLFNHIKEFKPQEGIKIGKELLRVAFGVLIIFISSRFAVEETLFFSGILNISPFIISLLVIAIGTNVPELSLVIRAMFMRNHQVAFGDYIGSAAFNTFLLGGLTLAYDAPVFLNNSYGGSLGFLIIGLTAFYYFARTKNTITRLEGLVLLLIYIAFIVSELGLYTNIKIPGN